jgi:hypothetical protein
MLRRLLVLGGLVTALTVACSDQTTEPVNGSLSVRSTMPARPAEPPGFDPRCLPGCTEIDSFPNDPGIFLTSAVTEEECIDGSGTDADQDDLVDRCERDLAQAFAPQLYYDSDDDVRREPYWAAKPNPGPIDGHASQGSVRIAYLLSYYEDLGGQTWACTTPPFSQRCRPHHGDSEWIVLDVAYRVQTKHWLLKGVVLSQHTRKEFYSTPSNKLYALGVFYPGKQGGFPRVWVAYGKHANYANRPSCDSGGLFGTDTCENNNTAVRVEYSGQYNIGSRSHRLKDCVVSRNPAWQFYGTGKTECYWSSSDPNFRGWYPDNIGGGAAEPYGELLANLGF